MKNKNTKNTTNKNAHTHTKRERKRDGSKGEDAREEGRLNQQNKTNACNLLKTLPV